MWRDLTWPVPFAVSSSWLKVIVLISTLCHTSCSGAFVVFPSETCVSSKIFNSATRWASDEKRRDKIEICAENFQLFNYEVFASLECPDEFHSFLVANIFLSVWLLSQYIFSFSFPLIHIGQILCLIDSIVSGHSTDFYTCWTQYPCIIKTSFMCHYQSNHVSYTGGPTLLVSCLRYPYDVGILILIFWWGAIIGFGWTLVMRLAFQNFLYNWGNGSDRGVRFRQLYLSFMEDFLADDTDDVDYLDNWIGVVAGVVDKWW